MPKLVRVLHDTKANSVEEPNDPSAPTIIYDRWAEVILCGCKVVVGFRSDNQETATVGCPCGKKHLPQMSEFNRRLSASLANPTDRQLVDVCAEYLEEVFA